MTRAAFKIGQECTVKFTANNNRDITGIIASIGPQEDALVLLLPNGDRVFCKNFWWAKVSPTNP